MKHFNTYEFLYKTRKSHPLTYLTGAHIEESFVQTVGGTEADVVGVDCSIGYIGIRGSVPPQCEAMRICDLLSKHPFYGSVESKRNIKCVILLVHALCKNI